MNYLENLNMSLLTKNLDGLWMRQSITSENIANYSTPGYKSKYVDFEHVLQNKMENISGNLSAVKKSDLIDIADNAAIIIGENTDKTSRLDGNNVDMEYENIELARTQINYSYSLSEIRSYMNRMTQAINGSK